MNTKFWGSDHIEDVSISLAKLEADFLNGTDWDITDGNNNATITGLVDPTNAQDAATKNYVDGLVDGSLKQPEAYDPTVTSNYPLTYGGNSVEAGDSFRITAAGTMGSRTVNVEDLLIALVDNPGASTDADWMVAESNRDQATETILGLSKIATQALTDAGVDDLTYITPLKLATNLSNNNITEITASNGLTKTGNDITLGGTITGATTITDGRASGSQAGIEYAADYSADFTNRTLVDKEYVDTAITASSTTTQYTNELHTTTSTTSGNTLYTLANLGTHATEKVIDVCLYFDGQRMTNTVDYTVNLSTGVITVLFDVTAGRQLICDYKSQDA